MREVLLSLKQGVQYWSSHPELSSSHINLGSLQLSAKVVYTALVYPCPSTCVALYSEPMHSSPKPSEIVYYLEAEFQRVMHLGAYVMPSNE